MATAAAAAPTTLTWWTVFPRVIFVCGCYVHKANSKLTKTNNSVTPWWCAIWGLQYR